MDIKEQKDISSFELDKDKHSNDYKLLVQKLKSIKERINLLEKFFIEKKR